MQALCAGTLYWAITLERETKKTLIELFGQMIFYHSKANNKNLFVKRLKPENMILFYPLAAGA